MNPQEKQDQPQVKLVCRECGNETVTVVPNVQATGPLLYLCKGCAGSRRMIDGMSQEQIEANPLARRLYPNRHNRLDRIREKARAKKFYRRNGFTYQERDQRVNACGWNCFFCGCLLTKEAQKPNSIVMHYTDAARSLENAVPSCRPCQCRKVGPRSTAL